MELSHDTAPTARAVLPEWPPLPHARLRPGETASALDDLQRRAREDIGSLCQAARARCDSIAAFADRVCDADRKAAAALRAAADV